MSKDDDGRVEARRLASVNCTFLLTVCLIGLSCLAVASFSGPFLTKEVLTPDLFVGRWKKFLNPEPLERVIYLSAVLAALPASLLAAHIAKRFHNRAFQLLFGPVCTVLLVMASVIPFADSNFLSMVLTGGNDGIGGLVETFPSAIVVLSLALVAAGTWYWYQLNFSSRLSKAEGFTRRRPTLRYWVTAGLFAVGLFFALANRIKPASSLGDVHFAAVFYSVGQVFAGKTINVDLPAQYGMYGELLYPLFLLMGLSVLKFTFVMACLQAIGMLSVLDAFLRLIRLTWMRIMLVLTLGVFVGSSWMWLGARSVAREYYQIWPLRFLFPAIALCAFVHFRRKGMTIPRIALIGLLAGIALLWNLDSGVSVYGALVASALISALFAAQNRRADMARLAVAALIPIVVVALFGAYLRIKSGTPIHWSESLSFIRLFYASGFGMLPLPLTPHPWMIVAGLYLYGLVFGVVARAHHRATVASDVLLFTSVMGTGLFTYYQGRSHDIVLAFALWPSIPIAFVLADRTLRAAQYGILPKFMAIGAAPVLLFGMAFSIFSVLGLPRLIELAATTGGSIVHQDQTAIQRDIAFVRSKVGEDRSAAILHPASPLYFGETGLASAVSGPGPGEALLVADQKRMLGELLEVPAAHLFIQREKTGRIPSEYEPLLSKYRLKDTSASGLEYLVPLTD